MTAAQSDPSANPVVVELLRVLRAQDRSGVWDGIPDAKLLEPFILTAEQRQALPLIADPDPEVLWRLEMFYTAIALVIERRTGKMASPIMKLHSEGWGRVVLVVGRLVAASVSLRDVHRFGFPSLEKLIARAEKVVDEAVAAIGRFPEAAAA
ncbi:MAG: NifX-associated nitrogen fixation protein [Magnetospirillum sp.]|nr:NifX-associated nitrogen fixation protein [Magnetospirillum sp.]